MTYNNAIVQQLRVFMLVILETIGPYQVTGQLHKLKTEGRANRVSKLYLVSLINTLDSARVDGFVKNLPVVGISFRT